MSVTVANLKVVKVLAATCGRVMDSWISLAEDIVEQEIRPATGWRSHRARLFPPAFRFISLENEPEEKKRE